MEQQKVMLYTLDLRMRPEISITGILKADQIPYHQKQTVLSIRSRSGAFELHQNVLQHLLNAMHTHSSLFSILGNITIISQHQICTPNPSIEFDHDMCSENMFYHTHLLVSGGSGPGLGPIWAPCQY